MTTTLTVGKRGTIVIPKAMRTQCKIDEGTQVDVSMVDNMIVLAPSVHARTRLDENFDQMRAILTEKGVTLEGAMQALREMRQSEESHE
ncbi:MAG: AbrB/MazE/SpoVT family DNA-binding domain-containing protein [Armatimonadetes bacterium]|nr:AbrB/MazE/SpoVT family DNA-binding domain-containing protein [Armatimonadota bacterium]